MNTQKDMNNNNELNQPTGLKAYHTPKLSLLGPIHSLVLATHATGSDGNLPGDNGNS
jgi:hypothetical protein